jgi:hypothetical protein
MIYAANPATEAPTEYCFRCCVWHYTDAPCNARVAAWAMGVTIEHAEQQFAEYDRMRSALAGRPASNQNEGQE